ncbi:RNA polymerase sigma factor [Streptomyces tauricus]|uniref:RNA polymerase sigma factor n=1 Tax=Streptomyces tauricus TaxID=68274 RepID=UPI00387F05A3
MNLPDRARNTTPATDAHDDFTDFYRRSYPLLVAQATASTTCRAGVLDAVQDAYTDLWIRWKTIRNPTAYTATAARHNLYAQARSQARTTPTSTPEQQPQRDPSDTITLQQTLLQALRELPTTQRAVVVAHYLQALTTQEIATALRVTPSTVRTHLTLGRRRMKTLLTPTPPPPTPPPPTPTPTRLHTPTAHTAHTLYERHAPSVYGYLYLHLAADHPTETLTSETFRLALPELTPTQPHPKTHLIRTARTLLTQQPHHPYGQGNQRHHAIQTLLDTTSNHPQELLLLALPHLTAPQYECIVLRYLQTLSITDSARIMNRTEGALKLLHHRALRTLAHHLQHPTEPADIARSLTDAATHTSHPLPPTTHQRMKATLTPHPLPPN